MQVNILLLGRNGNGKSSTGNSILGKKVFTPSSSSHKTDEEILKGTAEIDGKEISIVEGPRIGDTNEESPEEVTQMLNNVGNVFKDCDKGFDAVIYVLKYGIGFTKQEKDTVSMIRDIFGSKIFVNHGIIVMTYGDSFALDMEGENTTFEDWCKQQTGAVKDLFNECGNRYVLFNNREKDESSQRIQRDLLFTYISKVQANHKPYTLSQFKEAVNGRRRIFIRSKLPALQKENSRKLSEISTKLNQINIDGNPEGSVHQIEQLQKVLELHKKRILNSAEDTGLLQDLITGIDVTEQGLKTKLRRAEMLRHLRLEENVYLDTTEDENIPITNNNYQSRQEANCWQIIILPFVLFWAVIRWLINVFRRGVLSWSRVN